MAKGKVLLFQINIMKQSQIMALCQELDLDAQVIGQRQYGQTLGALAGLVPESSGTGNAPAVPGEMLVFCGLDTDQLDGFLAAYQKHGLEPVELKAILTPYNAKWTPGRLYQELAKERREIKRQS